MSTVIGVEETPIPEILRLEKSADAMGSTWSIILYGDDRARMEAAMDAAFGELCRIDAMLSNYRPSSEWCELNRRAAERAVKVSPELFRFISDCMQYHRLSEGAFDISVGPLMKAWGFVRGSGRRPEPADLEAALACTGSQNIQMDPAAQTVRFERAGVEIDAGGIGKGYAVDRMAEVLRREEFYSALVTASGSSIYGLGAPPTKPDGWRIEVLDPRQGHGNATEVLLKDMSISTSGSSQKHFWADGRIYPHILDPRTGYPVQGMLSVSVIAPRAMDSEAWSKPCFIHGREWAATHLPEGFQALFFEGE